MSGSLGRAVFVLDTDNNPLEAGIQRAEGTVRGFADRGSRLLRTGLAITFATPAFFATVLAANRALDTIQQGVIQFNSTIDQSIDVFTKYRGSVEAATARTSELFDIAKTTPFDFQTVLRGASVLEALGGAALASTQNLNLFGDAAAATVNVTGNLATSYERTTFWIARFNAALQSGAPLGESLLRLQELGLVNDKFRAQVQLAIDAGANPTQIFDQFLANLGRFQGLMALQQRNFQTQISTTKDNFLQLSSVAGRPIFDALVKDLTLLNGKLGQIDTKRLAEGLSRDVGEAIRRFTQSLTEPGNIQRIEHLVTEVRDLARSTAEFFAEAYRTAQPVLGLVEGIAKILERITPGSGGALAVAAIGGVVFRRQLELARDVVTGRTNVFQDRNAQGQIATGRENDRRDALAVLQNQRQNAPLVRQLERDKIEVERAEAALRKAQDRAQDTADRELSSAQRQAQAQNDRALKQAQDEGARGVSQAKRQLQQADANLQRQTDALTAAIGRETLAFEKLREAASGVTAAKARLAAADAAASSTRGQLADLATTVQARGGEGELRRAAAVETEANRRVKQAEDNLAKATYGALTTHDTTTKIQQQREAEEALNKAYNDRARILKGGALELIEKQKTLEAQLAAELGLVEKETKAVAAAEVQRGNAQTRATAAGGVSARQTGVVSTARSDLQLAQLGVDVAEQASAEKISDVNRQIQARQVLAQGASVSTGLLSNSTKVNTAASVAQARAAADVEKQTARVAQAQAKLTADGEKLAGATTKTNSAFGNLSQGLGVALVGVLAINAGVEKLTGESLPQAIADLIQFGDVAEAQFDRFKKAQNPTASREDIKKQVDDAQKQLDDLIAQAKASGFTEDVLPRLFDRDAYRNYIAGVVSTTNPFYGKKLADDIKATADQLAYLQTRYEAAGGALEEYSDKVYKFYRLEQERREAGGGTFTGPLPTLPDRPNVDIHAPDAAEQARQQALADAGLNLPKEILDRLVVDPSAVQQQGRAALTPYFAGLKQEAVSNFKALHDLMESGLKNAKPDGKLTTPDLIDLSKLDEVLGQAARQIQETGQVSQEVLDKITAGGGPAAAQEIELLHAFEALHDAVATVDGATLHYKDTQAALAAINERVASTTKGLDNDLRLAQRAAKDRADADSRALQALNRELEDLQKVNQTAQRELQANVERISSAISAAQDAATRAAAAEQQAIDDQQKSLDRATAAATQHAAAFDAVLAGNADRFLAEQDAVDDLTRHIVARYEAEIGAFRRLKDATSERATSLERGQRRELLAFDEAIATARERGDRAEVARLTRLRQQAEQRGSRQIALERERAGVAQDDFDERAARINKDKQARQDADSAAVKGEKDKLTILQEQAKVNQAAREADIAALNEELKIAQQQLKDRQAADAEAERKLSERIATETRAAEDAKAEDDRALAALEERNTKTKAILGILTLFYDRQNTKAKDALDLANDNLKVQKDIVEQLTTQNNLLGEQQRAWQAIIDVLAANGLLPNGAGPKPSNVPTTAGPNETNPGGTYPEPTVPPPAVPTVPPPPPQGGTPLAPTGGALPPSATAPPAARPYPDGTPWTGDPPPGYAKVLFVGPDHKSYVGLKWTGDPNVPVTPLVPPPPQQGPQSALPNQPYALRAADERGVYALQRAQPTAVPTRAPAVDPAAVAAAGGGNVVYQQHGPVVGTVHVRTEADIDRVARAIAKAQADEFRRQRSLGQPTREVA